MSSMKIAINGFGRIGRVAYRVLHERGLHKQIVAVNDLTDAPTLAHLLQYDSNYGKLKAKISAHTYENKAPYTGALLVDDHSFYVLSVKEPAQLPWKALGVDVVIESTGRFTTPEDMKKHLQAGARKVLLSAPVEGEGVKTIVHGVNDDTLQADDTMIANASCTTNCITPVAQVIQSRFGIEKAMMTTIHSYTQDQLLQDGPHKDLRRARAAAINIVPTTTGATKAAAKALPELEGIFHGLSIRVPTPVGSLSDFTFLTEKNTTVEEVNQALEEAAAKGRLKGILEVCTAPLVSSDIIGSAASAIVDRSLTQVVGGNLVKVIAWYDNEWGYANRLIDEVLALGGEEVSAPTSSISAPAETAKAEVVSEAKPEPKEEKSADDITVKPMNLNPKPKPDDGTLKVEVPQPITPPAPKNDELNQRIAQETEADER